VLRWGPSAVNRIFTQGNFTGEGAVGLADYAILSSNWNVNLQSLWLRADLDGDFDVANADLLVIADNAGMTGAGWADGDLDGDGEVTEDDFDIALAQWGVMGQELFLNVVA
jgi:hypothetical protein